MGEHNSDKSTSNTKQTPLQQPMSDFASFVAAKLRDKAMSDLLEENQKLREKNHALEFVEITGPERHPVYARGHLKDNGRVRTGTKFWDGSRYGAVSSMPTSGSCVY